MLKRYLGVYIGWINMDPIFQEKSIRQNVWNVSISSYLKGIIIACLFVFSYFFFFFLPRIHTLLRIKRVREKCKAVMAQKENVINNHAQCACVLERHDDKVVTVITDLGKSTRIDTVALPTTREYNYKVINLYNTAVCPQSRPSEIEERNAISVS